MRRLAWIPWVGLTLLAFAPEANARPVAPALFCDFYNDAPACLGGQLASCQTCHTPAGTKALNPFGTELAMALGTFAAVPFTEADFTSHLANALLAIEGSDADLDGYTNGDEIGKGSYPGSSTSVPSEPICPDDPSQYRYTYCAYDYDFALQRIAIDFCGRRASFEEVAALGSLTADQSRARLHERLDQCLDGEFWMGKNGELASQAHRKVRPVVGLEGFAPFEPDYALYVWAHSDDRNVQDVMLAQYNVLATVDQGITNYQVLPMPDGFPLQQERRAGLLTSQWMLFYNTMFTAIPRSTAAQAYRAYLNLDIALQEGLNYYAPQPLDYDSAGVTEGECITCHKTIEALVGPFSRYNGLQGANGTTPYQYDASRMNPFGNILPGVQNLPESGYVLGQPVADLREWASVAANSDEFYQAVTEDFWKLLIGSPPSPEDPAAYAEYTSLWQGLKADPGHRVELMLHAMIDTEAYGAP